MVLFTLSPSAVASSIPIVVLVSLLLKTLYNVVLHPLRKYPGSIFWAASRIPYCYHDIKGDLMEVTKALHDKYGPVVRLGPDQLSYTSAEAWRTIYGQRSSEMSKSLRGHGHLAPANKAHTLLTAPTKREHSDRRRILSHAFTESTLRAQEHYFQDYVGQLISKLAEIVNDGGGSGVIDAVKCYNATTFDAIGDLAFGEPFDCVSTMELHPFVSFIFGGFKILPILKTLEYYGLTRFVPYLVPRLLQESQAQIAAMGNAKLDRRLAKGVAIERNDFMSFILSKIDPVEDRAELENLTTILLVGGSETTATLLSGLTYYLLCTPRVYERLTHEIRSSFSTEDEITLARIAALP